MNGKAAVQGDVWISIDNIIYHMINDTNNDININYCNCVICVC